MAKKATKGATAARGKKSTSAKTVRTARKSAGPAKPVAKGTAGKAKRPAAAPKTKRPAGAPKANASRPEGYVTSVIRAGAADLDALVPLFDAYRRFYGGASDPARCRRFLAERTRLGQSTMLMALVGGETAGFAQMYPSFSSVQLRRMWILNDIYVHPDHRRMGVARALLDRAEEIARETGAYGIVLETASDNRPAKTMYESLGYVRDRRFHYYFLETAKP